MREPDYERSRAKVIEQGRTVERPWPIPKVEKIEFGTMPPLPDQALQIILGARRARPLAESHRGFSVAACAMVNRGGRAISLACGVNMKSGPGDAEVDWHAEEMIIKSLRPGDTATAIAIVGPVQPDQASQEAAHTLHPCTYRCQPMMEASEHFTDQTLIFCGTADGLAFEWGTLADFQRYHEGDKAGLTSALFETAPSILQPVPKREVYDLRDPSLDIDTTEWDRQVALPLIEWAFSRS